MPESPMEPIPGPGEEGEIPNRSRERIVQLDERRLLPLYVGGDKRAFVELLTRYRAPVFGYLVRCGVPAAVRDDLFQEIFEKVHRSASSYQPDRPLKPWLFTVVANTVRSHYRRQRVDQLVFVEERAAGDLPDAQALAESRETLAFIEAEIQRLPFVQREVMVLCCIEGLEAQEVATILDAPVNTIKTHLRRARLTLTRALARRRARERREVTP